MNYFSVYGGIWVQVVYLVFHFLECEETREQNAQIDSFRDMCALKKNHKVVKSNISCPIGLCKRSASECSAKETSGRKLKADASALQAPLLSLVCQRVSVNCWRSIDSHLLKKITHGGEKLHQLRFVEKLPTTVGAWDVCGSGRRFWQEGGLWQLRLNTSRKRINKITQIKFIFCCTPFFFLLL